MKYMSLCQDFSPKGNHLVLHDRHQAPIIDFDGLFIDKTARSSASCDGP